MQVNCDECKKDFEMEVKVEKINTDVERIYLSFN